MRITFFLGGEGDGGVVRGTLILAGQFAKENHDVEIVVVRRNAPMLDRPPPGVQVIDLGARRALTATMKLARRLRMTGTEVVVSAQHYANVTAAIAIFLSRVRPKLIVTERVEIGSLLNSTTGIQRLILPPLIKLTYPRAHAIVANSYASATSLTDFLGSRHQVAAIYNPTNSSDIQLLMNEDPGHPWLVAPNTPVILGIGRLVPQKDFPTLIRAFKRIQDEIDSKLIILGDGPEKEKIFRLIQELGLERKVDLQGHVSNPYAYLARASLFVLSSRYEGLPNALIEAQICGVPVVSTDCPTGPREILMDGAAGPLSAVGDDVALAGAASRILSDQGIAQKYVATGRNNLDRFSPERCYDEYMQVINSNNP